MTVRIEGTEAHLEGDWTISGVEENLDSLLLSLEQIDINGPELLNIDCGKIDETDTCGLQLLNVWMLCARLRGVELKMINVTNGMSRAIKEMGLNCFADEPYAKLQEGD